MDSVFLITILAVIALVGGLLFAVITMTRRGGAGLDQEKYQSRWMSIHKTLKKDNPDTYQKAIIDADKLLDHALKERGFKGNTMGERMKSADKTWKNANYIWSAHKIRNKIVHEVDAHVPYELSVRSLEAYKQALKDVGAI